MKLNNKRCKFGYTLKECNDKFEPLCQKECELLKMRK